MPPGCPLQCEQYLSAVSQSPGVGFDLVSTTLYKTEDGGGSWHPVGTPLFIGPIVFASQTRGWEVSQGAGRLLRGELFLTTTGGSTWRQIALPAAGDYAGISASYALPTFFNADDGVLLATFAQPRNGASPLVIYTTANGGRSWTAHPLPKAARISGHMNQPQFSVLSSSAWFIADGQTLFGTSSAGVHWTIIKPRPAWPRTGVFSLLFTSESTGFELRSTTPQEAPALWRSINGGHSWTNISS